MARHSRPSTYQVEPNIGRKNLILFVLTEENHHVGELLQFLCPAWDTLHGYHSCWPSSVFVTFKGQIPLSPHDWQYYGHSPRR